MKTSKRKKPDRGVLVGELCLIQYSTRRIIADAERNLSDLRAMEKRLDRLREENQERV